MCVQCVCVCDVCVAHVYVCKCGMWCGVYVGGRVCVYMCVCGVCVCACVCGLRMCVRLCVCVGKRGEGGLVITGLW